MILLTDANFNGIQLCFLIFFNWRSPESTICKKPHLQVFWQKNRFFQFVNFGVLQFKKLWKQSWMALELASVSSMISEILIKIGLKMTIFIYEFFGISLDAFTVSLYNRAMIVSKNFDLFGELGDQITTRYKMSNKEGVL